MSVCMLGRDVRVRLRTGSASTIVHGRCQITTTGLPASENLVTKSVFPAGDLEKEVMDRARRLAQGPSIAYPYIKENLNRAVHGSLEECMDRGHASPTHRAYGGPPGGGAGVRQEAGAALSRSLTR
jgi:hypothetical protein